MIVQKVVRTYPRSWTKTTEALQYLLDQGYSVAHITKLNEDITEYIVQKEVKDET